MGRTENILVLLSSCTGRVTYGDDSAIARAADYVCVTGEH